MAGGIPYEEMLCNWHELKKYFVLPPEAIDHNMAMANISEAICIGDSQKWLDLIRVAFDEFNLETFIDAVSHLCYVLLY